MLPACEAGHLSRGQSRQPLKDLKIKVATCQAIAMARRYGHALAVGDQDLSCPLTAVVFGFRQPTEFFMEGRACEGLYTETRAAGVNSETAVEKYSYEEYRYILVAPLHRTAFEPHVVVIYANAAQLMRLLDGRVMEVRRTDRLLR